MISRRKFLASGIAATGSAIGYPVVSNIGGRSILNAQSYESPENPYVTRGLINMYDGEWNAGLLVHDDNATIWSDLVGNRDLELGNGMGFSENALVCSGQGFASGAAITDEIVSIEFVECHTIRNFALIFQLQANRQCALHYKYDTYSFTQNMENASVPYDFGVPHSTYVEYERNGEVAKCYIDGIDMTDYRRARDTNVGYGGRIKIGAATSSYLLYTGSLYSLRVRNLALTEDEILANYTIDKMRFGL